MQVPRTTTEAVFTALQVVLHLHFEKCTCTITHTSTDLCCETRGFTSRSFKQLRASTVRIKIWQAEFGHAKMLSPGFEESQEVLAKPDSSRRNYSLDVVCLTRIIKVEVCGVGLRSVCAYVADMQPDNTLSRSWSDSAV